MNSLLASSLRVAALASTLFAASAAFAQHPDRAAQVLAATGSLRVTNVGPYVAAGTYRVQVSTQLGHPTATLPDGTWLYENFNADGSSASGTLVVRFASNRVTSLTLAGPAVVTALRTQPKAPAQKALVAAWYQQ